MISLATPPAVAPARTVNWGRFALVGLGTVVAAILANVVVYALGGVLITYDPQFLPLASVATPIFFTLVPAVVAVALYALLLRFAANAARTFTIIAAVVFVVTLIPDFVMIPPSAGASAGQTAVLIAMHVVAAATITGLLTRFVNPAAR